MLLHFTHAAVPLLSIDSGGMAVVVGKCCAVTEFRGIYHLRCRGADYANRDVRRDVGGRTTHSCGGTEGFEKPGIFKSPHNAQLHITGQRYATFQPAFCFFFFL